MKPPTSQYAIAALLTLSLLVSGGVIFLSLTRNSFPTPLLIVLLTIGTAITAGTVGAAVRLLRPGSR